MSNPTPVKITDLAELSAPDTADVVPVVDVDADLTKQITLTGLWQYVSALPASSVDITGGTLAGVTLNNSVIGGSTPAAATFTTITGSGDMAIDTDTLFVDASTNRVGILNASPSFALDVVGDIQLSGTLRANGNVILGDTSTDIVTIPGRAQFIAGTVGSPGIRSSVDTNTGVMLGVATDSTAFIQNGSEAARIDSSGNVGIGTTSPGGLLQVQGNVIITGITGQDLEVGGTDRWGLNAGAAYILSSSTDGGSNYTERVRITGVGRLGLNESAPDYLLDVNGTFGFTPGASVTPVDNGDVVFEATDNTTFTIKLKGSDGTVRSGTVTLS